MKFAQHLGAHITPEWHKQYIRYDFFKEFIYKVAENAPPLDESSMEERRNYFREQDEEFFRLCTQELTRVESFFCEKLAEAHRKYAELVADMADLHTEGDLPFSATDMEFELTSSPNSNQKTAGRRGGPRSAKKLRELKLAFSEFYLSLVLLQNYQQLNGEGFRKMLKKHDKVFDVKSGAEWRDEVVYEKSFRKNRDVDGLIVKVESLFTNVLEKGDRASAMKRLRVPPLSARHSAWVTFRVGLLSGVVVVLLICSVVLGTLGPVGMFSTTHLAAWRIFRGTLLLIVFIGLCGANTYGWRKAGVNHILIFEIDPRSHLSCMQLLEIALLCGVGWFVALIFYLAASAHLLPIAAYLAPFGLLVGLLSMLLLPIPLFYMRSRMWLIRKVGRCCAAPFLRVHFADFWLADQLNSLVLPLADLQFAVCFFAVDFDWLKAAPPLALNLTSNNSSWSTINSAQQCNRVYGVTPFITAFPALIRFLQCWRRYYDGPVKWHMLNAGKYSTTIFVVLFQTLYGQFPELKALLGCWVVAGIVSSTYGYVWDVKMDWGLFDKSACKQKRFLRNEIVYHLPVYYYAAIVEDLLIRFAWVSNVMLYILQVQVAWQRELVRTTVAFAEALRRCVWNFFRLENEHVNNCGQYRAVRDISIVPVTDRDYSSLESVMDSEQELAKLRLERKKKRREYVQQMIEEDLEQWTVDSADGRPRRRRKTLRDLFVKSKGPDRRHTQEALTTDDELLQDFWAQLQLEEHNLEPAEAASSRVA